jgi:CHASE2 domain-containing sensor protein
MGATLTVLCGLALWQMPLGERWVNASYDYLFRFGGREVTNKVVLILMDDDAYDHYKLTRPQWDRGLHAELLKRLTEDRCPLVVFDICFYEPRELATDRALAQALEQAPRVALMAELTKVEYPDTGGRRPILPDQRFLNAAGTNWGIGWLESELDGVVRRHWPFPAPGSYESLPRTAARLAGAKLNDWPQRQWLRYYGEAGAWQNLSYRYAFTQAPGYFSTKFVFIGNKPKSPIPGDEEDEFRTPYTRWGGPSAGGMEILATEFLNLMNRDWLRRFPWPLELLLLIATGLLLGVGLSWVRPMNALLLAVAAALVVTLGAVTYSHFSNFWFPWLVIVGGQVPCALGWSVLSANMPRRVEVPAKAVGPTGTELISKLPDTPDYELFDPPFGEGGFGKVWLVRNAIGEWQALKAVYQSKFGKATGPYEAEFKGIERYKPVSERHQGLLRIDFVSRMKPEGYFYYVMELGDGQTADWQNNPKTYKPWDLGHFRRLTKEGRVPVIDCVRIGLALTDSLEFLHRQGLTHRDVKPSNVIFVNGQPKLADIGMVSDIRTPDQIHTYVGTPGYMPPHPEPPGTVAADIYALGMLLYVVSTGREPDLFPDLSTTLMERTGHAEFLRLDAVILKACHPKPEQRFTSAAEIHDALQQIQIQLEMERKATKSG